VKLVENTISWTKKFFIAEQTLNAQNDKIYSASFRDIPEGVRPLQLFQKWNYVMVCGTISEKASFP
jgi:hypothetical protein